MIISQGEGEKINSFQNDENNAYNLKEINDSMSEKIRQNPKQKNLLLKQNGSNISSGVNTDKRNVYNKPNYNDEIVSGIFNRNGSQSSLSVDLNKFKINPNNLNNNKFKENNMRAINSMNINPDENFDTFNPTKEQKINKITNTNTNTNKKDANLLLKKFNPYDIQNYLGEKVTNNKKQYKKTNLINNIPPSTSNLQLILYNKKMEYLENQKNPDILFQNIYQKESRRMMVEYLKILNKVKPNFSLNDVMRKENINQLILLKPIKENNNTTSLNNTLNLNSIEDNNSIITNEKIDLSNNNTQRTHKLSISSKNNINDPNAINILNNFLNGMDDESSDKLSLITFLTIPRMMNMVVKNQKYNFLFYCSPTNMSCLYGIETYIFKWNECKNFNLIGYFDLINVENCILDNSNKKIFEIILSNINKTSNNNEAININENNHYYIEADDEEIAANYVQAINFISQLIKYRVYLRKKKKENEKNSNIIR